MEKWKRPVSQWESEWVVKVGIALLGLLKMCRKKVLASQKIAKNSTINLAKKKAQKQKEQEKSAKKSAKKSGQKSLITFKRPLKSAKKFC